MMREPRSLRAMAIVLVLTVAACAGAEQGARSYKEPSGPAFASDRDTCMKEAQFNSSGNPITFGGGFGGNAFFSSGRYMDCMVARGYAAAAIGDPLGTPAAERSIGGY